MPSVFPPIKADTLAELAGKMGLPADALAQTVSELLVLTEIRAPGQPPAHRALADAQEERARWLKVGDAARSLAERTALAYR